MIQMSVNPVHKAILSERCIGEFQPLRHCSVNVQHLTNKCVT